MHREADDEADADRSRPIPTLAPTDAAQASPVARPGGGRAGLLVAPEGILMSVSRGGSTGVEVVLTGATTRIEIRVVRSMAVPIGVEPAVPTSGPTNRGARTPLHPCHHWYTHKGTPAMAGRGRSGVGDGEIPRLPNSPQLPNSSPLTPSALGGGPARHPSPSGTCPHEDVPASGPSPPGGGDTPLTDYHLTKIREAKT
jgi:hypothetical protein